MSGGTWDYIQYRFTEVVESLKNLIDKNGKEKTVEELKSYHHDSSWYEKYPEEKFHHKYSEETIEEIKNGLQKIKEAQIYIQRIDWLLAGDDSEETFLRRLKEDLNKL